MSWENGSEISEEGQGMVEYALILVLISIVVIVILTTLGKTVNNVFSNVSHGLSTYHSSPPRAAGTASVDRQPVAACQAA